LRNLQLLKMEGFARGGSETFNGFGSVAILILHLHKYAVPGMQKLYLGLYSKYILGGDLHLQ